MAQRTYAPQLRILARALKYFINRYYDKIHANLTEGQWTLLQTLLVALDNLLLALPPEAPGP